MRSVIVMPESESARSSSSGRTSFSYWCVPRGNQRRTYSAPTMASPSAFSVRLMVATNMMPPGFTICAHLDR